MVSQLLRLTVLKCDCAVEVGEEDELLSCYRYRIPTVGTWDIPWWGYTLGLVFMAGKSATAL